MRYAEVSVNSPVAQRRTFSYAVPPDLPVSEGQAVWVPFGEKILQGIVVELSPVPAVEETREITDVMEPEPLLSPRDISLARWINQYYLSPLFDAVALMLPPGFERKAVTYISITRGDVDVSSLTDDQQRVLKMVPRDDRVEMTKLEKTLGKKKAQVIVSQMVKRGLLLRSYGTGPVRIKPKKELYIRLMDKDIDIRGLSTGQAALGSFLKDRSGPISWAETRETTGCTRTIADALVKKGLVEFQECEVKREPISYKNIVLSNPLSLTSHQKNAFESIKSSIHSDKAKPDVFLLHGVTGSGILFYKKPKTT